MGVLQSAHFSTHRRQKEKRDNDSWSLFSSSNSMSTLSKGRKPARMALWKLLHLFFTSFYLILIHFSSSSPFRTGSKQERSPWRPHLPPLRLRPTRRGLQREAHAHRAAHALGALKGELRGVEPGDLPRHGEAEADALHSPALRGILATYRSMIVNSAIDLIEVHMTTPATISSMILFFCLFHVLFELLRALRSCSPLPRRL